MTSTLNQNYSYLMFGYNNLEEFKTSMFGKWYKEFIFVVTCMLLTFWFGMDTVLQNINENVFGPATAFMMAMFTIFVDWLSGMYKAFTKNEFSTKKAQRILPKLLANAILLAGYFHFHKHLIVPLNVELLTNLFNTGKIVIAAAMSGIHGLSFLSNCVEADLISGSLAKFIHDKVDAHKKDFEKLI